MYEVQVTHNESGVVVVLGAFYGLADAVDLARLYVAEEEKRSPNDPFSGSKYERKWYNWEKTITVTKQQPQPKQSFDDRFR